MIHQCVVCGNYSLPLTKDEKQMPYKSISALAWACDKEECQKIFREVAHLPPKKKKPTEENENVDELINIEFSLQEKGFHPEKEEWIEIMKLYNFILDHAHENEKRIKFLTTLKNIINFLKEGTNFRYKREKIEIDISKWNKQKPIKIKLFYNEDTLERVIIGGSFVLRTYQKEEFDNDIYSIMPHRPFDNHYTSSVMIKNCFITKNEKLIIIIGMEFSDRTLNEKEINKVFTQEFKEQEITVYWGNNG